jgi:hypothetical protein
VTVGLAYLGSGSLADRSSVAVDGNDVSVKLWFDG